MIKFIISKIKKVVSSNNNYFNVCEIVFATDLFFFCFVIDLSRS